MVGSGQLAVGGGWRRLVVGDLWLVAVGSGWRLVVGGWRLVVGGWRSLRVVLNKKKIQFLKDPPALQEGTGAYAGQKRWGANRQCSAFRWCSWANLLAIHLTTEHGALEPN